MSIVVTLTLLITSLIFHINKTEAQLAQGLILGISNFDYLIVKVAPPNSEDVIVANIRKVELDKKKAEEERLRKEREDKINRTISFLKKNASPVANSEIASLIVDLSRANGADYRILIAIMGTESGYCRASFSYNCFGYINKAKYNSFKSAFLDLVPKISQQYAARYGWNFESLSKSYGQINWQDGASNMRSIANSI